MKALVHIGDQKTGSKAIQHFLWDYAGKLSEHGVGSLQTPKVGRYDMGLAAYARDEGACREYLSFQGITVNDAYEFTAMFDDRIKSEINQNNYQVIVFSFEGLMHMSELQIEQLYGLLNPLFDDIEILAYIRRQDRHAVSAYTTRLINHGATDRQLLYDQHDVPRGHNYWDRLNRWRRVFGGDALSIEIYDECSDVVQSFNNELNISNLSVETRERLNVHMSAYGQEVIRKFNEEYAFLPPYDRFCHRMRIALRELLPSGEPLKPSRREAANLVKHFEASNEKVRQQFLYARKRLFDKEFSEYPRRIEEVRVDKDDVDYYVNAAAEKIGIGSD